MAPAAGSVARPGRGHRGTAVRPLVVLAAVLGLLHVGGCAVATRQPTTAAPATPPDWDGERARLAALDSFSLAGRVAVKTGSEGFSASFDWTQDGPRFRLAVNAALARTAIALAGEPGQVTLRGLEGGPRTAADAEGLMRDALGWSVPMAGLRWWVRGIPDPGVPVDALEFGTDGRPSRLDQAGWRIAFDRPVAAGGLRLPGRITLEREQARVRLVIRRWTTG